jgi:uncharacterized protein
MELTELIEPLSDPAAYDHPVGHVEVRHTHISVVFLAGGLVYKVKKPVNLGFLDFSTLDNRRYFCEEEVRLNRRLAPTVYLGVVPVTRKGNSLQFDGQGPVVDWAVKMERLPDDATLSSQLERGEIGGGQIDALACRIACFHARADRNEHIAAFGRFEVAARNARENFEQSVAQVGTTLSKPVFERLRALTEESLVRLHDLIERRAERSLTCDTHGDLHLDHVYHFPERTSPADWVIIDCIEFNERFRFADPVADMAFLFMDLLFHSRRDLAYAFADRYFQASGDHEGHELLPFYAAYRAAVRGKVEGFELKQQEIPEAERAAALARGPAHWLLALGQLEEPGRRPCLVLVGGLPGTGKSTLAHGLAEQANFCLIRSDLVRKELAGLSAQTRTAAPFGKGIYTPAWTTQTYVECLRRAEGLLFEGKRVVVDASFSEEKQRCAFLEAAKRLGVAVFFLVCQARPEVVRQRLACRRDDASDANLSIYEQAAEHWEQVGPIARQTMCQVPADAMQDEMLSFVIELLCRSGLL